MYQHFIAVTSVYSKGQRIAWHFSSEHTDLNVIRDFMNAFKKVHGSMKLGIHRMSTNSMDWSSITERDLFFKDMIVIKDRDEFIQLAKADEGLDTNKIIKKFAMQA